MKTCFRKTVLIPIALAALCGCITGKALYLPGGLSRPAQKSPAAAGAVVAVIDFSQAPGITDELGRDYDHVREIRWRGVPGKTMADLVGGALAEKGYRVARVRDENAVPADAVSRVWGRVDDFRVNARRIGMGKAEATARVAMTVYGSGAGAPPGWNAAVTSEYGSEDAFVTPEGVRDAMNGAANAAADEVVRRLTAAGVVPAPPPEAAPIGAR